MAKINFAKPNICGYGKSPHKSPMLKVTFRLEFLKYKTRQGTLTEAEVSVQLTSSPLVL
jgi:hypothetical protein